MANSPFARFILFLFAAAALVSPSSSNQKVLLRDVSVTTLQRGGMTQGRRSPAVPQLTCVGGTAAKHDSYWPDTVQCENKGFDGYDYQWECKGDLDNDVKFGRVQMTCEGYDYPEDPYVLRGSCGLDYHLEFTREGLRKHGGSGGSSSSSWFGSSSGDGANHDRASHAPRAKDHDNGSSSGGSIFVLLGFAIAVYFLYTLFIAPATANAGEEGGIGGAPPPYEAHRQHSPYPPPPTAGSSSPPPPHGPRVYPDLNNESDNARNPPPAGWNTENNTRQRGPNIHGFGSSSTSAGTGSRTYTTTEEQQQQQQQQQQPQNQNQGFSWGSLLTGGFLGYLFGSGTNRGNGYWGNGWNNGYGQNGWNSGWGNGWGQQRRTGGSWWSGGTSGSAGWGSGSAFGGGSSRGSSGSRTTSGFGGTSRR